MKGNTPITALMLVLLCVGPIAAQADPIIDVRIDPNFFGHLDQRRTSCPALGCGATAAVNSFFWLQNEHPEIYGRSLIPGGSLLDAANTLLRDYMPIGRRGTNIFDFILGKMHYIEDRVPGQTTYHAQVGFRWPATSRKPTFVEERTLPSIDFLSSQLLNEEDVELFIGFLSPRSGHYITLTGIRWNTVLEDGEITFVDPANGQTRTAGIFGQGARPGIAVRYTTIDGEERVGQIRAAVAESATVPEPSPLHLLGLAIIAVAIVRHRQIRQQAE